MIRIAQIEDVPALRDIYNYEILNNTASFDDEEKSMEDRLAWFHAHTGKYRLLVYEENEEILGYASLSQYRPRGAYDHTAEISVYVRKDSQGRSIGSALMKELLKQAKEERLFEEIVSLVTASNEVSNKLHDKFGFRLVGVLSNVGKKFGKKLSVNIYQLSI